ncbi:MAG: LysR family transcriptional regulator [Clostridia bacterium]|nr:LysR family transcriptional regulator [Clostridia bacterium]
MEFLQLTYFQHAARTENFSHTATHFRVPPSSVSSSIKKLEDELETKLFDRSANRLILNENGKRFLKSVDNIFSELDRAKNDISDMSGKPSGKIHLLINNNRMTMTGIIADFRNKYPDISFILDFDGDKAYTDYDMIITDETITSNAFESFDFISEEVMLAVHKTNPISERDEITMSELENEKFICLHKNYSLRTFTDILCRSACISPDIVIECDDPQCIRDYLIMGMGVSLFPTVSWQRQTHPSIKLLRVDGGVYRNSKIYISRKSSLSTRIFLEHIKNSTSLL